MDNLIGVSSTSLNYGPIIFGSLHFVRCKWNLRFHFVWSSSWVLINRDTQFLPTGCGGGFWPRVASNTSAIRSMLMIWGGNPRRSSSRIYWTSDCSSDGCSFRFLALDCVIGIQPLTRCRRLVLGRCTTLLPYRNLKIVHFEKTALKELVYPLAEASERCVVIP